ncbi:MAG: M20 family metallopeptidase [Halanaerobiales bacterium]|nr:M20 family metallopeptidase [Halanaerobiales bacterium]
MDLDEKVINKIKQKAKRYEEKIIEYRRILHQNPELGLEEHKTSEFIKNELKKLDITVKDDLYNREDIKQELDKLGEDIKDSHGSTGLVGILEGSKQGKTVLLRSDMDALKVNESEDESHLPSQKGFRSSNEGIMHACGHDSHIAMLLGSAHILSEYKNEVNGKIKFLFQPDEERGCGAKLMKKGGVLEDVDAVFGIHVWSPIESGKVMINKGPMMASVDNIWLNFKGGGGHSSAPNETEEPLLAGSELVNQLYKMNSRKVDTRDPSLISVESFNSEADWGVIPDQAKLKGTIRTFDEKVREDIISEIKNIGESLAKMHNLKFEFNNLYAFPPTINTEDEAEIAIDSAQKIFGDNVFTDKPVMSGEDFSYYLQDCPGAFIFLGISNKEVNTDHPHHNPNFDVDESLLNKGAALHSLIALNYLNS